jgi:peptide/nickel transport system substrate-binding protein
MRSSNLLDDKSSLDAQVLGNKSRFVCSWPDAMVVERRGVWFRKFGKSCDATMAYCGCCASADLARPLRKRAREHLKRGRLPMKRRDFLKSTAALAGAGMVSAPAVWSPAKAQSRQETLLIVSESGPNNVDIHGVGTNVPGYEVSWNCYDRLISHEMKTVNGVPYYDRDKLKPELAEDMNVGDMSATFKLKKNAVFQDGTPVTAKDVKWSLDRAVSVGGFPTFQMGAGSLTKPEQFVVVDDHTFRVDFMRKDRLTIPDLAVIVPCIINSELVKKHATEKDPWGMEYTKQNTAGSGAYRVVSWTAGSEVILERNDKWTGGKLPKLKRIVWRMVPSAGNRRALLERGDADISYDLPNKDFVELKSNPKLSIISTPYSNGIQYIGMNVTKPPFNNLKVRQAVAYAIPYQKIMDAVLFGLSKPMFGAPADKTTEVAWPQPHKFNTDIAKAKQLMAEAGYPNGFETTLSFDLGFAGVNEPLCVLTQESLAQIGIKCTINKIPGATWRTELNKKVLPLYTNVFSGWLDYPEYFFIWCYHGKNSIFNTMSYQSKTLDGFVDGAVVAAANGDKTAYEKDVRGFVDTAFADMPRIPIFQPYVNVAMQKNVSGYQYWFHRRLDYRAFEKG